MWCVTDFRKFIRYFKIVSNRLSCDQNYRLFPKDLTPQIILHYSCIFFLSGFSTKCKRANRQRDHLEEQESVNVFCVCEPNRTELQPGCWTERRSRYMNCCLFLTPSLWHLFNLFVCLLVRSDAAVPSCLTHRMKIWQLQNQSEGDAITDNKFDLFMGNLVSLQVWVYYFGLKKWYFC